MINVIATLLLALPAQTDTDTPSGKNSTTEETEKQRIAQALTLTREAAEEYQFTLSRKGNPQLELHPQTILRWSNPVAGSIHGNVFIWTHHGRPEMVSSIFKWFSPLTHMSHEFHSLSVDTVKGTHLGRTIWTTSQPGVRFSLVPSAPAPAANAARRLLTMRTLARRFTARKTDRENVSRELRLLTQPVHRYQSPEQNVLDGALFVFVQGTDPEVWLMIESRQTDKGQRWHYALARMNSTQFVVDYKDQEVWRVETLPWSNIFDHSNTYTSFKGSRE